MASWDSYTQKATPEDNDTLMLKDTAAGANKRTPFSGVWNWIVNKMTNAVISNLETSNKMIIPAINELNSKIGGNILSIRINATNQFKIKSMFDSIPTSGMQRQSIFMFGCANGVTVYGMITLFSNTPSSSRWDGVGDVEVDIDSDGIVTVTVPKISYDVFTCISGNSIAQT